MVEGALTQRFGRNEEEKVGPHELVVLGERARQTMKGRHPASKHIEGIFGSVT